MEELSDFKFGEIEIDELGLNIRCQRALHRSNIHTISGLIDAKESDQLYNVFGIGDKNIAEIESKLLLYQKSDRQKNHIIKPNMLMYEIIQWQKKVINKQISCGLLHGEAWVLGKSISKWINEPLGKNDQLLYGVCCSILGSTLNICEELEYLFSDIQFRSILIFLRRCGFQSKTLEEVGYELKITRERVRQINKKVIDNLCNKVNGKPKSESISLVSSKLSFPRIQSALYIANDMGLNITNDMWKRRIQSSGLLGDWNNGNLSTLNPIEVLFAVCNSLEEKKIALFKLPPNLSYVIKLTQEDEPNLSARVLHSLKHFPKELKKEIKRHIHFVGGVNIKWLSNEVGYDLEYFEGLLPILGFVAITKDWYIPANNEYHKDVITYGYQPIQRNLRKMFQYCGPLSEEDICSGLRNAVSRTDFPVPPPIVMKEILHNLGYINENNLFTYNGGLKENLSRGEKLIMDCFLLNGKVVNHSELVQIFIKSNLSFPLLHKTLDMSPLFDRIETGLYKLRGLAVSVEDVARAENSAERIPINLTVQYDKTGLIRVNDTLSALVIATGDLVSEQLPNLSGDWSFLEKGEPKGKLTSSENKLSFLYIIKNTNCQAGNRIQLIFNTWNRTVEALIIAGGYGN